MERLSLPTSSPLYSKNLFPSFYCIFQPHCCCPLVTMCVNTSDVFFFSLSICLSLHLSICLTPPLSIFLPPPSIAGVLLRGTVTLRLKMIPASTPSYSLSLCLSPSLLQCVCVISWKAEIPPYLHLYDQILARYANVPFPVGGGHKLMHVGGGERRVQA